MEKWKISLIIVFSILAAIIIIVAILFKLGIMNKKWINNILACVGLQVKEKVKPLEVIEERKEVCNSITNSDLEQKAMSGVLRPGYITAELQRKFNEIDDEYAKWDLEEEARITARDLQDKLDFIARSRGRYQLDQNNRIVLVPIPDDEGIGDEANIDVESIHSVDDLDQSVHSESN